MSAIMTGKINMNDKLWPSRKTKPEKVLSKAKKVLAQVEKELIKQFPEDEVLNSGNGVLGLHCISSGRFTDVVVTADLTDENKLRMEASYVVVNDDFSLEALERRRIMKPTVKNIMKAFSDSVQEKVKLKMTAKAI